MYFILHVKERVGQKYTVGWVKRSETQQIRPTAPPLATLNLPAVYLNPRDLSSS